ncbi:MAG: hypothetical protein D4R43_01910 [Sphingobacteriales bacterium]|nr:MAG: hypothetical protein D4R43_01910 [Sphingobacteriales bacterium]
MIIPSRFVPEVGEMIDGKYQMMKKLGEGTFGMVYRAKDNAGNEFAVKVLKLWDVMPEERELLVKRFTREFECGQIDSPHLVRSMGYGSVNNNPYIVMDFCSGGSLNGKT